MKAIKQVIATLSVAVFLCLSVTTTAYAYAPIIEPEPEPEVEEEIVLKPVGEPLTPEGNLSLVDDIITNNENDKQFITAVSKSGNYFYLVIDRAGDTDNVYLLNMVDEADLMALMYDEPVEVHYTLESQKEVEEEVEPEPEPEVEEEPEPEEEEEPEEKSGSSLPLLLAIAALGGGGFFYFKSKTKGDKGGMSMDNYDDEELDLDDEEL